MRHGYDIRGQGRRITTGLNADALGFGLKDEAFTFNLNAAEVDEVGEEGVESRSVTVDKRFALEDVEAEAPIDGSTPAGTFDEVAVADDTVDSVRFPRNGGIFWMNIPGFCAEAAAGVGVAVGEDDEVVVEWTAAFFRASLAAVGLAAATGPKGGTAE